MSSAESNQDPRIKPFALHVPSSELDDLRRRLRDTRWPGEATTPGWQQGVPLRKAQELAEYWEKHYDWRRCERELNEIGQFTTLIDGVDIHFLHMPSPEPSAVPLVLTHGWPGSVVEFLDVIRPLADPRRYGGDPAHAFHVVVPSLPGFGFSGRPTEPGWGVERIARAWVELMRRLGYDRFYAQGGDWGAAVSNALGSLGAPEVLGIHINMVLSFPDAEEVQTADAEEQRFLAEFATTQKYGTGYGAIQGTRPQTLSYGLTDSPIGQATWILEKFQEWSDNEGDPTEAVRLDRILDCIMLYWLPRTAGSSARIYWETFEEYPMGVVDAPMAASIFRREPFRTSRRWAQKRFPNIVSWNDVPRGGHFAALEQPALFIDEVREGIATLKRASA